MTVVQTFALPSYAEDAYRLAKAHAAQIVQQIQQLIARDRRQTLAL